MIEALFDGVCEPRNPGGHAAYGVLRLGSAPRSVRGAETAENKEKNVVLASMQQGG